jgi:hypothetical protein
LDFQRRVSLGSGHGLFGAQTFELLPFCSGSLGLFPRSPLGTQLL